MPAAFSGFWYNDHSRLHKCSLINCLHLQFESKKYNSITLNGGTLFIKDKQSIFSASFVNLTVSINYLVLLFTNFYLMNCSTQLNDTQFSICKLVTSHNIGLLVSKVVNFNGHPFHSILSVICPSKKKFHTSTTEYTQKVPSTSLMRGTSNCGSRV